MDIAALTPSDTAACTIVHPGTRMPTDIKITLYGIYSDHFRQLTKSKSAALLASADESKADEIQRDAEYLADLTESWEGVDMDGKPLKCTRENAIKVYKMSGPIRGQVTQFVQKVGDFLPKA
jgi:hypothetical protein